MTDPESLARNRFIVISALRLGGVAMVIVGLMLALGRLGEASPLIGYVLIGIGLFDFAVVPVLLARKWRTPPAP